MIGHLVGVWNILHMFARPLLFLPIIFPSIRFAFLLNPWRNTGSDSIKQESSVSTMETAEKRGGSGIAGLSFARCNCNIIDEPFWLQTVSGRLFQDFGVNFRSMVLAGSLFTAMTRSFYSLQSEWFISVDRCVAEFNHLTTVWKKIDNIFKSFWKNKLLK